MKVLSILEWKANIMATVGYGDFRTDKDTEVEVDSTKEIAPGENYVKPSEVPVSRITPAYVDPNIGRFTQGTVGENGIGQPIENTQEGMSFESPLFGYEAPSGVKKEKRDTGRTAIDIARETAAKNKAAREANEKSDLEKNGPVGKEDTYPADFEPASNNEEGQVDFGVDENEDK